MANSPARLLSLAFLLGCIYLNNVDAGKPQCAKANELCKGHGSQSCCPGAQCYFFYDRTTKTTFGKCVQAQPNYSQSYYEELRKNYSLEPDLVGPVDPADLGEGGVEYDDGEGEEEYEDAAQPLQPAQLSQLRSPMPMIPSYSAQPLPQYPSYPQPQQQPPQQWQPFAPALRQPSAVEQPRWQQQFLQMQAQQQGWPGY